MQIRPLNDKLLVARLDVAEKVGSLFIPDAAKEKGERAKVIAAGPGKALKDGTRQPMACKEGDVVLLSKWPGGEVKIDGKEMLIISEEDVLAVEA